MEEGTLEEFRHLPFFRSIYKKMKTNCELLKKFFEEQIAKHKENPNVRNSEPTDYVEAFIQQQQKMVAENAQNHFFTDEQLIGTAQDLWIAGQETTSTTLAWVINYVTLDQEIQLKIHAELDNVIGSDRLITINDKINLPYINAVVNESQRHGNIVAFNLFHRTTKDVSIKGYKIPKNTIITDAFPTILKDERYFDNPKEFKPERFIDENGKFFTKSEVIPFGVGKRACLGEGLARMELFLFTANIFNQFKLTQISSKPITEKRIVGGTTVPESFVVNIKSRWK